MLWGGFGETHCRRDFSSSSFSAATNYPSPSSTSNFTCAAADIPRGNCSFQLSISQSKPSWNSAAAYARTKAG
ncbi:unnamed protein product, partial [Musa banksii]